MKFLIDMPLSPGLAIWLVQQGHDAVHAFELGLARASDEVILERARREQRVVITADLDYPRLLALAQAERPGLILFRGGNYSEQEAVERLSRALETVPTRSCRIPSWLLKRGGFVVDVFRLNQILNGTESLSLMHPSDSLSLAADARR